MARIRTVKPEFFRHELLQDLEEKHGKLKPMLTFEGLWTLCDKNGNFEWRPRQIKLDVLPFLSFNIEDTLNLLKENGFIVRYEINGHFYGHIPTFEEHQRITGKELQSPGKYPEPTKETIEKHPGSTQEAPEYTPDVQEKEREKERKGYIYSSDFLEVAKAYPKKSGSKKSAFIEWQKLNGEKPSVETVIQAIQKQIEWRERAGPGDFRPEWKDLERWIKHRMWESEVEIPERTKDDLGYDL